MSERATPAAPESEPKLEPDEAYISHYAAFELDLLHHAITVADAKASFALGLAVAFAVGAFQPTVKAIELHQHLREVEVGADRERHRQRV